jgi:hypothetical protein
LCCPVTASGSRTLEFTRVAFALVTFALPYPLPFVLVFQLPRNPLSELTLDVVYATV